MTRTEAAEGDRNPDIDDVLTELDELEELVDGEEERQQVRETMRTARKVRPAGIVGRFRTQFGPRDAGEALVGSFVFGLPMIVEGGVLDIGRFIAAHPSALLLTLLFGAAVVFGILRAGEFERVAEDRVFGVVPLRPIAIVAIASGLALALMTGWGRVSWSEPMVAGGQTLLVAIAMSIGASVGDILPEN